MWAELYLQRGDKQLILQRAFMKLSIVIWVAKYSSMILKLKHVFKAHKVGRKCQKFPFWTSFKAMKVQTLTHRTISLLTDVVPNIFEGWKNNWTLGQTLWASQIQHSLNLLILRLWGIWRKSDHHIYMMFLFCFLFFILNSSKCYLAKDAYIWEIFWVIL